MKGKNITQRDIAMTSHSNNEFFSYEDENAQMSSDDVCRVTWNRDYKKSKSATMQRLYRRVNAKTFPQPVQILGGPKRKIWYFNNEEIWRFNHL